MPSPPLASTLTDPSLLVTQKAYIDGSWVPAKSGLTFPVHNPATSEILGPAPDLDTSDLADAVASASASFPHWRSQPGRSRSRILRKLFTLLVENKVDLGKIITAENGKSKADAEGEVLFAASFFEWFSEEAPRLYGDVVPHSNAAARTMILKQPVGVCGLITPWNFPLAMGARKVAAALAAGCTVVMKSDGVTPFSSFALAVLAERAGVPRGVFNVLTASAEGTPKLGLAMCEDENIKKISFTGSTRVGKLLAKQASGTLKKLSLELGGNAPFIVFDDADVEVAVAGTIASKFKVTGQTCVCANRILVQEGIYEKFAERLVEEVKKFKVGNGAEEGVTHGPMTTSVDKVEEHVKDAVGKNAKVLLGGNRLPQLGNNFFELTVLGDVDDSMLVMRDETFGPLAAISKFSTEEEAVRIANSVPVGLASYVITTNLSRYYRVAEQLDFGMVAVNTGVISDSAAPFGGVKHSGWGREGSKYGCDDYMVMKTVVTGGIDTVYQSSL